MAAPVPPISTPLTPSEDAWVTEYLSAYEAHTHVRMNELSLAQIFLLFRVSHPRQLILPSIGLDQWRLFELQREVSDESVYRASPFHALPLGMPHFPVQPWEHDMSAWMTARHVGRQPWYQLVALYETSFPLRNPNVVLSSEILHANALVFAHEHSADHLFSFQNDLMTEVRAGRGPGTASWHYLVERISPRLLGMLIVHLRPKNARWFGAVTADRIQLDKVTMLRIFHALRREESRRTLFNTSRQARADFATSGLMDFMSNVSPVTERHQGGRDAAQIVGQFHSGLITPRRTPSMRHSGPVRSFADVLEEIAEEARALAAAAAATSASAVHALEHVAGRMAQLTESVAKRHKH